MSFIRILVSFDLFSTGYNIWSVLTTGNTGIDTDHDKLLAQLETELKESQQLVRLQQQLLQVQLSIIMYTIHTLSPNVSVRLRTFVCREVVAHPSPLNWLIHTFWKSGSVFR